MLDDDQGFIFGATAQASSVPGLLTGAELETDKTPVSSSAGFLSKGSFGGRP